MSEESSLKIPKEGLIDVTLVSENDWNLLNFSFVLGHSARMRAGSSPTSTHFQSAPKVVEIDEIC